MTSVPALHVTPQAFRSDEMPNGDTARSNEVTKIMQVFDIQGYSYEPSEGLLRNLNRILVTSGGWVLDRRLISSNNYEFTLEIELRFALDLYAGIIASGVELTRANHLALTDLCTCRLHLNGTSEVRQIVGLRLEVCFLKQQGSQMLLHPGCSVA